jgi:hypothetical protein
MHVGADRLQPRRHDIGQQLGADARQRHQAGAMGVEARRAAFVDDDMRFLMADHPAIGRAQAGERDAVGRRAGGDPLCLHRRFEQVGKGAVQPRAPRVAVIAMVGMVRAGDGGHHLGADRGGVVRKEVHGACDTGRALGREEASDSALALYSKIGQYI